MEKARQKFQNTFKFDLNLSATENIYFTILISLSAKL